MKLKDSKICYCWKWNGEELEGIRGLCRAGYCVIMRCPYCKLIIMEWGPVACPHKKDVPRWYKHPDMDEKFPVWVKGKANMGVKGMRRKRSPKWR